MLPCFGAAGSGSLNFTGFGQKLPVKRGLKTGLTVKRSERGCAEERALAVRKIEPAEHTVKLRVRGRKHNLLPVGTDGGHP